MTWRELKVLVAHLPRDSHTVRAHLGEAADWTLTNHLLAAVFDAVNMLTWHIANMGAKTRSPRPDPIPRPGVEGPAAKKTVGTALPIAEIDRILGRTPVEEVSVDGG